MPTLFRPDGRSWKYVPFAQADAPTRAAFRAKALRIGVLEEGGPRRFTCVVCSTESDVDEIGASFGDAAIGTPICPAEGCTGIGWDYFTPVGATPPS